MNTRPKKMSPRTKMVYSTTIADGARIQMVCRYNPKTEYIGIMTAFIGMHSTKRMFSYHNEGVEIHIRCVYTPSTDHVCIATTFHKRANWNGGAATNPTCTAYLGIMVGETVLAKVFSNVHRMPYDNEGYDFICGKGYKIDVKSACLGYKMRHWRFNTKQNTIADHFLCLAFDNRDDLNPVHLWLIPSEVVSHLKGLSISKGTVDKWKQYELTDKLDRVIKCCNTMKS